MAVRADDRVSGPALALVLGCADPPLVGTILGRSVRSPAGAGVRLQVIGGADAGASVVVGRGTCTLGRDRTCELVLTDPRVSRLHAALDLTGSGAVVHDLGSTNGTSVDGVRAAPSGASLRPGQVLRIANTFLALAEPHGNAAAVRAGAPGRLLVNRRPRSGPGHPLASIALPALPASDIRRSGQWLGALLPAAAGVGLAVALGSAQFLAFALLSPLALLASAGGDRVHRRRERRSSRRTYDGELTLARAHISAGLAEESVRRRAAQPDPATVAAIARTPLEQIWERGRTDADLLRVRIGLAALPSELCVMAGAVQAPAGDVHAVPLTTDLQAGPLGIAGPRPVVLGMARWLVGQIATQASPKDVEIAALLSDDVQQHWAWLRWLPHLRSRVATNAEERARLCADLADIVASRTDARPASAGWLVLVVDRARNLGELRTLADLLADGPAAGITAVCLDDRETLLPAGCQAVAVLDGDTGARVVLRDARSTRAAIADQVGARWTDGLTRSLAPLTDASNYGATAPPEQCRLVALLGRTRPDADAVLAAWKRSNGQPDVVLGVGADGPVLIDLERDGPHALVAGTTGAGKSELLRTLVVGLAVAHPPDETSFVLVDYKGGSAFAECARLPHAAGLVTDLDEFLTRRALRSLEAELRRRERLFAAAGAADLAAYRATGPKPGLTRLVLVIDEFAALATELPEFVDGLVGIAQRGRSLGVHLVLATQRPAGVVSQDIRANTALRIALRMTDTADSTDVIDSPDAAHLERRVPGRALVRRGDTTIEMQVARVSGRAAPVLPPKGSVTITPLGPWRSLPPDELPVDGASELCLLVDAAVQAAEKGGYPPVHRPWLAPLPAVLSTADARGSAVAPTGSVCIGLLDLPDEQRQSPLALDLAAGGSLLLAGGPRSGRTSGLLSLALAAATSFAPTDLELYGIDGGGALTALARLPHTGAVVSAVEHMSVVDVLLRQLGDLAGDSGPKPVGPVRVLLLDGWEAFADAATEYDNGRPLERLLTLLRDGPPHGFTVVVAGGRATLAPRIAGHFGTRVVLPFADAADLLVAGVPHSAAHSSATHRSAAYGSAAPGRGHRVPDGAELQLAIAGASAGEFDEALQRCSQRWDDAPRGAPVRVRPLPARIRLTDLTPARDRWILGVGGTNAEPIELDLFAGAARLLVAGPPQSGKSRLLQSIVVQAERAGVALSLAAPARSPLRTTASVCGIDILGPGDAVPKPLRSDQRVLLVVDDSEAFNDTALGDWLADCARSERAALAVVAAARSADLAVTFRGIATELRRVRCGLLLQPGPVDGELLGIRVPRTRQPDPPGRGVLVPDPAWKIAPIRDGLAANDRGPVPIQVALP